MTVNRVLIYRLASLGDTVVALPALRIIANAYPSAERRMLTQVDSGGRIVTADHVLGPTGLINGYIRYPVGVRSFRKIVKLVREIRAWKPDVCIYLNARESLWRSVRDALFLKICGVKKIVAVPYGGNSIMQRVSDAPETFENETVRLVRLVENVGEIDLEKPETWDLQFTEAETDNVRTETRSWTRSIEAPARSIVIYAGAKVFLKDWEHDNWATFLQSASKKWPDLGAIFVGSNDDHKTSEELSKFWSGPFINLCGRLSPRETALAARNSLAYVGHDGGPMHLVAATGVPCVAIFSSQSPRGVWFPLGPRGEKEHQVLYNPVSCQNCGSDICKMKDKRCILGITPDEVMMALTKLLS